MDNTDRPARFPYEVRYCIECERIAAVVTKDGETLHMPLFTDLGKLNVFSDAYCYGPFTYSTPPDYPANWNEIVQEPDDEELALMNEEAELLLADLQAV